MHSKPQTPLQANSKPAKCCYGALHTHLLALAVKVGTGITRGLHEYRSTGSVSEDLACTEAQRSVMGHRQRSDQTQRGGVGPAPHFSLGSNAVQAQAVPAAQQQPATHCRCPILLHAFFYVCRHQAECLAVHTAHRDHCVNVQLRWHAPHSLRNERLACTTMMGPRPPSASAISSSSTAARMHCASESSPVLR